MKPDLGSADFRGMSSFQAVRDSGEGRGGAKGTAQYASCKQTSKALVVRLVAPSIGQHEAPIVSGEIANALMDAPPRCKYLVLDLSAVSVVSSMGLAMCIDVRKSAKDKGMKTVLFGLNAHLRGLLRMMRVERLYKIVHSKDDLNKMIKA